MLKKEKARSSYQKFRSWLRHKFQHKLTKSHVLHDYGFKSIQIKSVQFSNSRFRDELILMANLTRENAIDSFVQNLDDMKILLMSMSSSVL